MTRRVLNTPINPPETQAGCRFPADPRKKRPVFRERPSPVGRGWRAAPGEGSPPHDLNNAIYRGAGCPHPALSRHLLPVGEGSIHCFQDLFRTALVYSLRLRAIALALRRPPLQFGISYFRIEDAARLPTMC